MSPLEGLEEVSAVRLAREALAGTEGAWIVGGAIRDAVLDRNVIDVDIAVAIK